MDGLYRLQVLETQYCNQECPHCTDCPCNQLKFNAQGFAGTQTEAEAVLKAGSSRVGEVHGTYSADCAAVNGDYGHLGYIKFGLIPISNSTEI